MKKNVKSSYRILHISLHFSYKIRVFKTQIYSKAIIIHEIASQNTQAWFFIVFHNLQFNS